MRILVIDDEPAMLKIMGRLLEQIDGVEISGMCRNSADALSLVEQGGIDLAFVDIKIAGDDGLVLASRMRAAQNELEIVFVTSHIDFAYRSFNAYPLDYMVKPVSLERLKQTIARAELRRTAQPAANPELFSDTIGDPMLRITGLGAFSINSQRGGVVKISSRKSHELFAYMLVHHEQGLSQSRIIEEVFPDRPLKNAKIYLNTAMYQLRRALQQQGLSSAISFSNDQYRLSIRHMEVDFINFETFVTQHDVIDESSVEAALHWEARYYGDLFEDRSYPWATSMQIRLSELYAELAKRLIGMLLAGNEGTKALPVARRLAARHEWNEEAHVLLLQVLGQLGDKAALHSHFEQLTSSYNELNEQVPTKLVRMIKLLQ